jgi:hypothetical protein
LQGIHIGELEEGGGQAIRPLSQRVYLMIQREGTSSGTETNSLVDLNSVQCDEFLLGIVVDCATDLSNEV